MTTQELDKQQQAVVSQPAPEGISGESDPSDFVTPFVKLVQKGSEEGKPGTFLSTSGEERESVSFVVLHIALTRTYFVEGSGLVCSSRDRMTGNARQVELLDRDLGTGVAELACNSCQHYEDSAFDRKGCSKDYLFVCYDTDQREAFMFRVKGSARGVFINKIIGPAMAAKSPPWGSSWTMTSTKKQSTSFTWYEPELALSEKHDDAKRAEWAAFAQQYATPERRPDFDADDLPFE